ncbi:hypothetical protein PINS_up012353 [Pythium insidiosum]|nr:hypothetical protein PINS_up012353 [Pythium insidiosum]
MSRVLTRTVTVVGRNGRCATGARLSALATTLSSSLATTVASTGALYAQCLSGSAATSPLNAETRTK